MPDPLIAPGVPVAPDPAAPDPLALDAPGGPARWTDALLALPAGDESAFDALAQVAFAHQLARSPVYRAFAAEASAHCAWTGWRQAPLLPIEAFRLARVATFDAADEEACFVSSGTTAQTGQVSPARHLVRSLDLYRRLSADGFRRVHGDGPFIVACYLPGYAERGAASSLVAMAEHLVATFGAPGSVFFLDDLSPLTAAIRASEAQAVPLVLLGAAFGLLVIAESGRFRLPATARVVETGGMKTRRREMPREALHAALAAGFGVDAAQIGSEFGMAEMTSQGWARSGGRYAAPPWMRARALDPAALAAGQAVDVPPGATGQLAIVDLASVYACPFLATADRAIVHPDGTFEVLGRMPEAALRGCNFLLEP